MLTYISNESKTFEERFLDAVSMIPLYTDDWTDYNPSDPGITILEILTGFETLQQDRLLEIPPLVARNLLAMVGFRAMRGRGSRLLISAEHVKKAVTYPPNHSFLLGDLSFETNRSIDVDDWHLIAIYGKQSEDDFKEYTYLNDHEMNIPAKLFGEQPEVGDALYLVSNKLPPAKKETILYFTLLERYNRNPLSERSKNTFASLSWECYTEDGWKQMDVRDNTNALLMSGEVKLWIPEGAAVCHDTPTEGYCIRAVLKRAQYDVYPRITGIDAFLFETWQKRTMSECHSFGRAGDVTVRSGISEDVYVDVFCREAKGSSYRRYEYTADGTRRGRFYDRVDVDKGTYKIIFDKKLRGYGPERGRDCVKVLIYTEEVASRFRLGRVLGYDNQQIELPYERLVSHSFCIVAKRSLPDGSDIFDFVRPEKNGEGALFYHLFENDGIIEIEDAGDFIGAELFLAAVSTHSGADGNIRAGNTLVSEGDTTGNVYYNPGVGTGGAFHESLREVRTRFLRDMDTSYTCVTAKDYENVVKATPGLCIHKARAYMDEDKNLIRIAIKPGTDERFPRLSDVYQEIIRARLDERRLLTTRTELMQPVYTAVNVSGTVYIKLHYENGEKEIEDVIREHVDYLNSDKNFGDRLHFDEIFHAIEILECVEYVYDLQIRPAANGTAVLEDADICPSANCLLYPGQITIEAITFEE